ncbi:AAA family ATPase [Crassaminicella thermophila]|uniref:AAA family ATPase n=1 Tax=Crassaminicella thermophila TaxID=2599308 RepID=A0A5C0SAG6_CRATE|nr:AAA family ATPase [Crassaminicella thermophila]QEK11545.1 AAA family ATPase [Crassaminicella thermophila]
MLLKSLKLSNFRQFRNEEVQFSTDSDKNVTIIIGENGTGKTTFSQAFFWCLYGDVDFKDKSMLNKIVASELTPDKSATVKVILSLIHAGTEYEIIREQVYKINYSGKLKGLNSTLNIQYKKNGQQEFLKPLEIEPRIKEILPKELSKYFFFDGERIEKMSKEIQSGRKSYEFAQAVRGLLGLSAFISALEHLKPTSKGVIGSYENSYDAKSNINIARYTDEIDKYKTQLEKIENRLKEIENEILKSEDRKKELEKIIQKYAEGEKLQNQKKNLINKRSSTLNSKRITIDKLLREFNDKASSYFARSMIKKSLEILGNGDFTNKDIPEMHAKTIDFLIKKGTCLCGTPLEVGSKEYNNILSLLQYLPPQSIGIAVGQFIKESQMRAKTSRDLFESYSSTLAVIEEQNDTIAAYDNEISLIEKNLVGIESVAPYQSELQICEKVIRDRTREKDELIEQRGSITTKKERANTERQALTLRDETNKKIEIYKAYAQYMYDEIKKVYKENENFTRKKLEDTINNIFKDIYQGGLSLTIDENYNIAVLVDDYEQFSNVETSTAQSIAVIFAFISGIIKMARESNTSNDERVKMLASEPYPLVMDAPLSAFDKRRIESVCKALPNIAEQVIIFIKDTDGDLAKEHMGEKIGKQYRFDKLNEFETVLN